MIMDKKIRAVGVVIKDKELLVMWRKRPEKEYYTFPGGGVEEGEKVQDAVVRELLEETSVQVKIKKLLYHVKYSDGSEQCFYLCDYVSGELALGEFNEKLRMDQGHSLYRPMWVSLENVVDILLYPLEVRDWLIDDSEDGFIKTPRNASFNLDDLRQN